MSRQFVGSVIALTLCLTVSLAYGEPRRGGSERNEGGRSEGERSSGERSGSERSGGERSGNQSAKTRKPPGGSWSEYNPSGKQGKEEFGNANNESGAEGAAAGHAASKRNSQPTGAEGAAAGAARSNRNSPQATGAEGAAAGAAAENRKAPQASGAEGAAAGAAAANRNNPKYSGAQGAAAGAAAANRNQPKYSGAQGAAAGAAVANNNAPATSGAAGAAAGYAAVRNNVNHPGMYSQQWYGEHQSAWTPNGWSAGTAWTPTAWTGIATQCGYGNTPPISYNYGANVTCVGGNVVVDGQPAGTAEDFSHEADILAEDGASATTTPNDKWMPLGVFALVRNEQQHPQLIMQLAVNQQGVLRGNYTDEVTDSTQPVRGAVDPKTKRAAWMIGDNRYAVMEAGLQNLTQSEAPALLHKNGTTQRWLLVRLSQASAEGSGAASAETPQ